MKNIPLPMCVPFFQSFFKYKYFIKRLPLKKASHFSSIGNMTQAVSIGCTRYIFSMYTHL